MHMIILSVKPKMVYMVAVQLQMRIAVLIGSDAVLMDSYVLKKVGNVSKNITIWPN